MTLDFVPTLLLHDNDPSGSVNTPSTQSSQPVPIPEPVAPQEPPVSPNETTFTWAEGYRGPPPPFLGDLSPNDYPNFQIPLIDNRVYELFADPEDLF